MLVAGLVLAVVIPAILVLSPRRPDVAAGRRGARSLRLAVAVASALALLGSTAAVAAQQDGSEGASSASSPDAVVQASEVTVSGRVTDGSGNGIQDVVLKLRSPFGYVWWTGTGYGPESSTDSDGNYVLSFDVDDFDFSAAEMYGDIESASDRLSYLVDVTPSDDRYYGLVHVPVEIRAEGPTRLNFQLGSGARVSGSLADPDGMPVAHSIRLRPDELAVNAGNGVHSGGSDESGHFEIGGIPPGRYWLDQRDRFSSWEDTSRRIYVTVQEGDHHQLGEVEVIPYSYSVVGRFLDDEGSVHEPAIDVVAGRGILRGTDCGRGRICPTAGITRAVMAVWLGRALAGRAAPQEIAASRFADVDVDGTHAFEAAHIERFAELGVTAGCRTEPLRYCPDRVVTRAEMATFLQRALDLEIPDDPAGFIDVDSSSVHARSIDALRASGITLGCDSTGPRYCPDQTVTRGEMATFIHRSLELLDIRAAAAEFEGAQAIQAGSRVSAELQAGATNLYRLQVSGPAPPAGRRMVVETHSELDLYATLSRVVPGALHDKVAENDDGGQRTNALIDYPDPEPGWYLIEIRGYSRSIAGDYELSVTLG